MSYTKRFLVEIDFEEEPVDGQRIAVVEAIGGVHSYESLLDEDVVVQEVRVYNHTDDDHELLGAWAV